VTSAARAGAAPAAARPVDAPAAPVRKGLGYLPALDGIRGLSVLAVVAFHLGRFPGGYLGVDAFFVLSGFLITSLLLVEHERGSGIDLVHFYERRVRRLLPALLVLLLGVVVWARVWALPGELDGLRGEAMAALFYIANWWAIAHTDGYWDLDAAPSPFEHMWSLAIEEQFYFLWPVLFVVLARLGGRSTRIVGVASLGLAAASALAMVALYDGVDPNNVYLGTHTRAQAILLGAALAWFLARRGRDREVAAPVRAAGWAMAAVLALMWWRVPGDADWMYQGGFTLHAVLVAGVIAVVVPHRGGLARVLSWRPLRAVGAVSYGLYLYHWPAIVWLTPERTGMDGWSLDAVRVGAAVAATMVSYWLIERPLRFSRRITPRQVAVGVPVSMAVVAAVLVVGLAPPRIGLERLDGAALPPPPITAPATVVPPAGADDGEPVPEPEPAPTVPEVNPPLPIELAPGERLRVAYVGDSIGTQVAPYMERVLGEGIDFVDLTGAGSALCDWFPAMEDQAATPPHVFVIDHGGNALTECMLDENFLPLTGEPYQVKYRADTAEAIRIAQSMGARTLLVDQPVSRGDRTSGTGELFREAATADTTGTVRFFSSWPAISPDGVFRQSAPCESWEPGCIDGSGELRSPPPGVHLEPLGQFRYALAIRDDLFVAGWLPGAEG
jgi:peptidoglycan/LPS O-acetylase OafA/YrhL